MDVEKLLDAKRLRAIEVLKLGREHIEINLKINRLNKRSQKIIQKIYTLYNLDQEEEELIQTHNYKNGLGEFADDTN